MKHRHLWRARWLPALVLLPGLCLAGSALAEEAQPRHFVEAGLGGGLYQISDDVVRGLRWQGPSLEIDAAFRYATEHGRHDAFFRIGMGYLHDRYEDAAVSLYHHIGYGYTRRVFQSGAWGSLFLGAQLREDVDLQYYIDWDEEHAYWLSSYGLAAAARYEVSLAAKHGFAAALALPVVGWVGRPPAYRYYKADNLKDLGWLVEKPFTGLAFASLPKYQAVHLGVAYVFRPRRGWALRVAYLLDYRRASFPRPAQILTNTLTAGFIYAY